MNNHTYNFHVVNIRQTTNESAIIYFSHGFHLHIGLNYIKVLHNDVMLFEGKGSFARVTCNPFTIIYCDQCFSQQALHSMWETATKFVKSLNTSHRERKHPYPVVFRLVCKQWKYVVNRLKRGKVNHD